MSVGIIGVTFVLIWGIFTWGIVYVLAFTTKIWMILWVLLALYTILDLYVLIKRYQNPSDHTYTLEEALGYTAGDQLIYFIIHLLVKSGYAYLSYKAYYDPSMGASYVRILSNNSKWVTTTR